MDELIAPNGDGHVGRSRGDGRKKEQIPGRQIVILYRIPHFKLISDFPREGDAVLRVNVLREAAAVESCGIRTAVAIRRPAERERGSHQTVAIHG